MCDTPSPVALKMATDSETTETFMEIGVPRAVAGYFLDSSKTTAHLFPGTVLYHTFLRYAKTLVSSTDMRTGHTVGSPV